MVSRMDLDTEYWLSIQELLYFFIYWTNPAAKFCYYDSSHQGAFASFVLLAAFLVVFYCYMRI